MINSELFTRLVAEAALAPSVHNTQPARWHMDGTAVVLLEDVAARLPAADPAGRDALLSIGAALEGMVLAAGKAGLLATVTREKVKLDGLIGHARVNFKKEKVADPLAVYVEARRSWRGAFAPATDADRSASEVLTDEDLIVLRDPGQIDRIARLCDKASLGFMEQTPFRKELLSWMRLNRRHDRWGVDGLNADALHLGRIERLFAGLLLGPAFGIAHGLGLARVALSEAPKTRSASGVLVFHRPEHEDPLDTGRAFYRAWLQCEARGFGAAILAALADDSDTSETLRHIAHVPHGRRIVSVLRIGRRPSHEPVERARREVDDLIV